jgi:hypothetical protein
MLFNFLNIFCSQMRKDGHEEDDGPLNLSIRADSTDSVSGGGASVENRTPTSLSSSDYYACKFKKISLL